MGELQRIKSTPEAGELWLLTVVSARKDAGSSPTGIVGRSLARDLLAVGDRVRVIVEPDQFGDWPDAVEVVEGAITRPLECAEAFNGVDGIFLRRFPPLDGAGCAGSRAGRKCPAYRRAVLAPPSGWWDAGNGCAAVPFFDGLGGAASCDGDVTARDARLPKWRPGGRDYYSHWQGPRLAERASKPKSATVSLRATSRRSSPW